LPLPIDDAIDVNDCFMTMQHSVQKMSLSSYSISSSVSTTAHFACDNSSSFQDFQHAVIRGNVDLVSAMIRNGNTACLEWMTEFDHDGFTLLHQVNQIIVCE
jgi:hypothetical protein